MASPPQPPVRRTSRLGAIPTPHAPGEAPSAGREDPAWLDRRDRTPASAKKSVGFSDRDPGPGVRWPAADGPPSRHSAASNSLGLPPPAGVAIPRRGDSRAAYTPEYHGHGANEASPARRNAASAGQHIFDRFGGAVSEQTDAVLSSNPTSHSSPEGRSQRAPASPLPDQSRWAALKPDDRAMALLAMTPYARMDVYRNESRKMVTQAICTALSQDQSSNPKLLLELDAEIRADILSYLSPAQRAVAVGGMPYDDRMKTLHQIPAEHIGPALVNLSPAEVLKTFKGLDAARRPAVFADLDSSDRTVVLAWTPSKSRMDLLLQLRAPDRAAALLSLPLKECCSTIRSMSPFHAECVLLEMSAESRSQVLSSIPERDLSRIVLGMPVDKQVDVLEGLAAQALYHAFRCIPAAAQAILFDDLSLEESAGLVGRMTSKERAALVASLPSTLKANVLRMLEPKEAAVTLRGLDKDDVVGALEEMNAKEQAEIIQCLSGKDRTAILSRMEPYERAIIMNELPLEDRMVFFRSLDVQDVAKTMSEMTPEDNLDAISNMTSSERADVFSVMNPQERSGLAMMLNPEVLASTLAEMSLNDRKDLVNTLPADEKAVVLCSMTEDVRALLVKSIMPDEFEGASIPMRPGRDGDFLDTLRNMGPEALHGTLEEMAQRDKVSLLLMLPVRERVRVLDRMKPMECADLLDCFLLEDRANTISSMSATHAALVLAEMHPYKKAILLAAVGERDRLTIMGAMTGKDMATVLSALPPADSIATLRSLGSARGAEALGHMAPEERAVTMEAMDTKDRAAILSHIEPGQAAYCLGRLTPEECAATLRLLKDDALASIANEIPAKPRGSALLACPIKFRVHVLSLIQGPALSSFMDSLDHVELTATVKSLSRSVLLPALPSLSLDSKVRVLGCVGPQDACHILEQLGSRDSGEVVARLPIESCAAILKCMNDDCVYATLTHMDRREREKILSGLSETLQMRISKILMPAQKSPAPGHQVSGSNFDEPPRQPESSVSVPLVIPVRRPASVSPPSSPSKGHSLDVEVTVNMKFNEDFDWLTADEHRKTGWSEWIRGMVCEAVKVSPRRIRLAGLQRGSVCLLLQCLPLSETPGIAESDNRSAMELALQILAFASAKDAGTKLPKFLGGALHSLSEKPWSHGTSPEKVAFVVNSSNGDISHASVQENCGVGIAFAPTADGKHLGVIGMIPGGDADRSGLIAVGDIVSSINGHHVQDIPIPKLAQRIRGPVGTRIQIGFKAQHSDSEKNIDLPRIPATMNSPWQRPASSASSNASWDPNAIMPVQLSFLSEPKTRTPQQQEAHHDWHLTPAPNGSPQARQDTSTTRSPGEGRVLRVVPSPTLKPSPQVRDPLAARHDIWGTLEQLDASIQRRNTDMRSFTDSLLKLQAESAASNKDGSNERGRSDFFYA